MTTSTSDSPRTRSLLDEQWKFRIGDFHGAEAVDFDDRFWRTLDLPHDWSVEIPRDENAACGGAGGYFQNGIGWYRKTLLVEPAWTGKRVWLEFEGVYCNATVFINGEEVETQPYGYIPFTVDLSDHLAGESITIAVRVNHSEQATARWFTGSGIYRHVWLHSAEATHIATTTFKATTLSLSTEEAILQVEASVTKADTYNSAMLRLDFHIYGPNGTEIAAQSAVGKRDFSVDFKIPNPLIWSPETPSLYRLVARLHTAEGGLLDEAEITTGLRTLSWSAELGLVVNGKSIKLYGGNVHHDNGILGAAAFDRAEERKVELLKSAGFNAVRTAHNPPSPAFLDACDRLGLFVIDEVFDGWAVPKTAHGYHKSFSVWHAYDLERWLRRDWNHPSVICWSIGNEMPDRATPQLLSIAKEMAALVRTLDPTRPISAGLHSEWGDSSVWPKIDPLFEVLDIGGYNYELAPRIPTDPGRIAYRNIELAPHHARDHERAPQRIVMGTETFQYEAFVNWQAMRDYSYVVGDFVWTALDYLGEVRLGQVIPPKGSTLGLGQMERPSSWPWRGTWCGEIDLTGWRKPSSHYREIVWNDRQAANGQMLYMAVHIPPSYTADNAETLIPEEEDVWQLPAWAVSPALPTWDWPRSKGRRLTVEVFSRYEAVRLYLNDQLIGEQPTGEAEEFKTLFRVPYTPGELIAVGMQRGKARERFVLKTGGHTVALRTTVDRSTLRADGQDLAFITIEAVDSNGQWRPWSDQKVTVQVTGAGLLAGLGTGNTHDSLECYSDSEWRLYQGRALAIVRTLSEPGEITVRVSAASLAEVELKLTAR